MKRNTGIARSIFPSWPCNVSEIEYLHVGSIKTWQHSTPDMPLDGDWNISCGYDNSN